MNDRYVKEFREKYQPVDCPKVTCQCAGCKAIRGEVLKQGVGE